jgi:hypothetical protein
MLRAGLPSMQEAAAPHEQLWYSYLDGLCKLADLIFCGFSFALSCVCNREDIDNAFIAFQSHEP